MPIVAKKACPNYLPNDSQVLNHHKGEWPKSDLNGPSLFKTYFNTMSSVTGWSSYNVIFLLLA